MSNLLLFISDFKIGITSLMVDQASSLHKEGINVYTIGGNLEQESGLKLKIKNTAIPFKEIEGLDIHSNYRKISKQIADYIYDKKIKYVHVQNNWQLALIIFCKYVILRDLSIKIIYTIHGYRHNHNLKSFIARIIIGLSLFLFVDKIICMCSFLKNKFRLLSYKIHLIPLGINKEFFSSPNTYTLSTENLNMIFAGQFRKGKNQDILIKAFAKYIINKKDTQSLLILPGNGPLLNKMKELSVSLGVKEQVIFPGQCNKLEILELYNKSNIGLIPSNTETFGQSIAEPFVLGRCIITRKVGIAIDIIKDNKNGFIFEDENDLIEIFNKISNNKSLISNCGNQNYKMRNIFDWNEIAPKYKKEILH